MGQGLLEVLGPFPQTFLSTTAQTLKCRLLINIFCRPNVELTCYGPKLRWHSWQINQEMNICILFVCLFICLFVYSFGCVVALRTVQQLFSQFITFPVILGGTSTKQRIKCLAQGHDVVLAASLEPLTPRYKSNR